MSREPTAYGLSSPGDGRGYSWDADTKSFKDITELNPGLAGGAGAVVSTLSDLHTYVRALCTGELREPATQVERLEGVTTVRHVASSEATCLGI